MFRAFAYILSAHLALAAALVIPPALSAEKAAPREAPAHVHK
jgi:hypothetical protein